MTDLTITDEIAPPDSEEYAVLLDALSRAKTTLYGLRVHAELEREPAPEGQRQYANLLAFLTRGKPGRERLTGTALAREIEAAERQVAVLNRMLEAYNAHEEAFRNAQVVDAPAPKPVDSFV